MKLVNCMKLWRWILYEIGGGGYCMKLVEVDIV